jgi:hypothetical protein
MASDISGTTATPDGTSSTPTTDLGGSTAPGSSIFSGVIAVPGIGNVPKPVVYGSVLLIGWLLLNRKKG